MLKLQRLDFPETFISLAALPVTLGQHGDNKCVIDHSTVSDFHAEIDRDADGLIINDLLSKSGTFVNNNRINRAYRLNAWDVIRLGAIELQIFDPNSGKPGVWALQAVSDVLSHKFYTLKDVTIVGRDADCDLPIDWHLLSRRHARITIENDGLLIEDLHSRNGTYVNGKKIDKIKAHFNDEIQFDNQRFIIVAPSHKSSTPDAQSNNTQIRTALDFNTADTMVDQSEITSSARFQLRNNSTSECYELQGMQLGIGRAVDNEIVLNDSMSSKYHARLVLENNQWFISDNQSRNGLRVNDVAVSKHKLAINDKVEVGKSVLVFEEVIKS